MKWFNNLSVKKQIGGGFALVTLILVVMSVISILGVQKEEEINLRVIELRAPTVLASTELENGINLSLAALRGWMILNNPTMKEQRKNAWHDIDESFAKMKEFSKNWTNPKNVERLALIEQSLGKFSKAQQEIENISGTLENTPATKILVEQAAPRAAIIVKEITNMINLEAKEAATKERKSLLGMMADVRGSMGLSLANIRAYLLTGDSKFSEIFAKFWATNEKRFADLSNNTSLMTAEQKASFDRLKAARSEFSPLPPKMFEIRGSKQWNLANHWLGTRAAPEAGSIMNNLIPMVENQNQLAAADSKLAKDSAEFLIAEMTIISIIGTILAIIISYLIVRSITRPLAIMLAAADDLRDGDGDLTQRLPDFGSNEIGRTALAFNGFIEKIQDVLIEVRDAVHHIGNASSQISSTAQTLSQGSSEQAASVEETSASLEQMSASINQNTDNAKATDSMASKAASEAEQGGEAVKETVSAMTEIAGKIGLIEDIAYKTNLLALNAAIEAARAGEHGKGFAVVADEVRKLAERSQVSSQEISELAASSVSVSQKAGSLLEEIVPSIQQTANLVMEISASSEEQSVGVNQVNQAIDQLDKVSQQNAAASEELASTSDEMASQTQQLQSTISFFTLSNETKEDNPKTEIFNSKTQNHSPSVSTSFSENEENDFVSFNKSA